MFLHINSPIDWRRAYKQSKESWKQASQATPTHDMTYQNVDSFELSVQFIMLVTLRYGCVHLNVK